MIGYSRMTKSNFIGCPPLGVRCHFHQQRKWLFL